MKKYLLLILFLTQTVFVHGYESVVCLHGFFRSFRCMIPVANAVRNEGHNAYLWDYPSRKKTIEEHAANLVEVLNAIAKQNPGKPIHFVTHSLGGVIVRAAVSHPDCPQEAKIGRAVLLAPPNRGAILARSFQDYAAVRWIFGSKAGAQLLTYDEKQMLGIGKFPETMQVMVIAGNQGSKLFSSRMENSHNDGKVTVEETKLDTPHIHHTMNVSHSWIMTSRETMAMTKNFLFQKNE